MAKAQKTDRLNVLNFGLALGIAFGVGMLLLGLFALWFNWGTEIVNLVGTVYIGYAPTFGGSIIGGIWAFFDSFIGGVIIAWLYNLLQRR